MESLYIWSDLPSDPPNESNWGHKIADFVFLLYISFVIALTALECIKKYWETIYMESLYSQSDLPPDPALWVKLGS